MRQNNCVGEGVRQYQSKIQSNFEVYQFVELFKIVILTKC